DLLLVFFSCSGAPRDLHSFPTRRSSDLTSTTNWRWLMAMHSCWRKSLGISGPTSPPLPARHARYSHEKCAALERRLLPPRPLKRSEEHTSELQSRENLVCRLLLEKKKQT